MTRTTESPNAFIDWCRHNRLTCLALLCVTAAWLVYAWFGRAWVQDIFEGNSWAFLNNIIYRKGNFDLEHYHCKVDIMVFGYGIMFVLGLAFFSSLWSGRRMGTGGYIFLLGVLSLSNIAFILPVHDFGALIINDDYPKFYSTGVENADALLGYGSPFGYNHNFQGGIPAFYLKSCFLCLVPFISVLGNPVGHQCMLIVSIMLIPVSLYLLVRNITRNELIAQVAAFMAAFQIRSFEYLTYGMSPAILATSLFFLSLVFLLKYVFSENGRLWLFATLVTVTVLLYTHLVYFALVWFVLAVILVWVLMTRAVCFPLTRLLYRILYLGILMFLAGLPFFLSLLDYSSLFRTYSGYATPTDLLDLIYNAVKHDVNVVTRVGSASSLLLGSSVFLLVVHAQTSDGRLKLLIKVMLFTSAVILVSPAFQGFSHVSILAHRTVVFAPFVFVLNVALCLAMNLNRRAKAATVLLIFILVLSQYPLHPQILKTVDTFSGVDPELQALVSKEDHVLFENTTHVDPSIKKDHKKFKAGKHGHWLTYLQKSLGARFFSNVGEDPHTYNKLRHMYVANGTYQGKPLRGKAGAALVKRLEEWGVNKVCVRSESAKAFFARSESFSFLADSEKFRCYIAKYERREEVRLSGAGTGRITEATPFSMTVSLENISRPQTVTVARNAFKYWTACDEAGEEIPLKKRGQMISFDVEKEGLVHFHYRRHTLLYIMAILALFFPLVYYPWRKSRDLLPD